jgi:hypothetical protein
MRIALGETTEVDAHAVARETHAARACVEFQHLPADRGAAARQRGGIRRHALSIVVQAAGAGVGDVESAL